MKNIKHSISLLLFALLLSACSGAPKKVVPESDNAPEVTDMSLGDDMDDLYDDFEEENGLDDEGTKKNIDPLEGLNRKTHAFNMFLDRNILRPAAKGYDKVMPKPLDNGIDNVMSNLGEPNTIVNDLLQFKILQMLSDTGRLVINSTLGLAGIFDVATPLGLKKHKEDFGQTLGTWGVSQGPYIVLPVLGPSTLRDSFGRIPDTLANSEVLNSIGIDAFEDKLIYGALYGINIRQRLLSVDSIVDSSGADPYLFIRDAYLQTRENSIKSSDNTPPQEEDLLDGMDEDFIFEE